MSYPMYRPRLQRDPRVHTHFVHGHYQKFIQEDPTGTFFDMPHENWRQAVNRNIHINVTDERPLAPIIMLPPPNVPEGTEPFFAKLYGWA